MKAVILPSRTFSSPIVNKVAKTIIPYFQLETIQSALSTNPDSGFSVNFKKGNLGLVYKKKLESYNPATRRKISQGYLKKLENKELMEVKKKAKINLRDSKPVLEVVLKRGSLMISNLKEYANDFTEAAENVIPHHEIPPLEPPPYLNKRLQITLKKVTCLIETNDPGKDEIAMAFVRTDELGTTTKTKKKRIGSFQENDVKTLDPSWLVADFPLDENYEKPKLFTLTCLMAEKDWGGFGAFLNDVYDAIQGRIMDALVEAGMAIGSLAGPIGVLVGAIVAVVFFAIIGWLIDVAKDDFFEPVVFAYNLESSDCDFSGSLKAPFEKIHYPQKGKGRYSSEYEIELIRDP